MRGPDQGRVARPPVAVAETDALGRLAITRNPFGMLVSGVAWRCAAYVATSILAGFVALACGIAGFAVLPGVAARLTRLERLRLRLLGLPPLDAPAVPHDGGWRWRGEGLRALLALWAWTVLFALVDAVPLGIVVFVIDIAVRILLVSPAYGAPAVVLPLLAIWAAITFGLYLTWALASSQARAVQAVLRPESDLAARVAELTTSRNELVDVFEAERRRIERDLHDGAQQHLVVCTMRLGEAAYFLELGRTDAARESVLTAQQSIEEALAALRDTVRGLHPQVLTDRGLVAAVRELVGRSPLPTVVSVEGAQRALPPTIANAAYHVASEALTNVAKHAGAGSARLRLAFGDTLVLTVEDDGAGGARAKAGHGLSGLAERMAAVGGTLEIASPPGGPTRLSARFPISAADGEVSGCAS
ncbi:MAG: histidine kinase [Actinomycetia bacterium]|nr:histidine kinase [Actinomycetes bacterium]